MSMVSRHVKLTELEAEVLEHRLSASDAIAQALTDRSLHEIATLGPPPWSWEHVEETTRGLLTQVERQRMISLTDDLAIAIAEDCMTGSTYFANLADAVADGEETKERAAAMRRARTTLHKKLSAAAGRELGGFPPE